MEDYGGSLKARLTMATRINGDSEDGESSHGLNDERYYECSSHQSSAESASLRSAALTLGKAEALASSTKLTEQAPK